MTLMALFLDIGPGDELRIGDNAVLTLEHKSGRRARIRIAGEADVELVKDAATPLVMDGAHADGGGDDRRP